MFEVTHVMRYIKIAKKRTPTKTRSHFFGEESPRVCYVIVLQLYILYVQLSHVYQSYLACHGKRESV